MKDFTTLFRRLDETNKTNEKVKALVEFFENAGENDKLWAIALLSGRRPKRQVRSTDLHHWCAEESGLPLWLFEETYHIVGDLAETIAKVLPPPQQSHSGDLSFWMDYIIALGKFPLEERREKVLQAWRQMDERERFVFNKMMLGSYRIGISQTLMVRALAQYSGVDKNEVAHRLMGQWDPASTTFEDLLYSEKSSVDASRPYPFYLAYQLEKELNDLGAPAEWIAEYKWDGIRGQLIVRDHKYFLWSRGEELITHKFPEFARSPQLLPNGTVLDGEVLPFKDGAILPFQSLQTRIGRKNVSRKILEESPAVLRVYDILEWEGEDVREQPQKARKALLQKLFKDMPENSLFQLSEELNFDSWPQLEKMQKAARDVCAEGLMLKHKDGSYQVGRKKGDWWKWKVEPLTIDAVLIYAMRGHGRRTNLYTDYTFAVWKGKELVPFAKAYSGLSDAEFRQVDNFVKRHTVERFGPVRSVKPQLVFELAFEGIQKSSRHKSGVALRFPRMKRWRKDKVVEEANTMEDLEQLLEQYGS